MQVGSYQLDFSRRTIIMGILNVTPDSFSDGGRYTTLDQALFHAEKMIREGADLIDIGGESTRPGASKVSLDEELERVIPVIERLTSHLDVPISIDTYKSEVAKEALKAGVSMINDVWGAKADPAMAIVAAESGMPIVLMHNRDQPVYTDLIQDVIADLEESVALLVDAGVRKEQIILDPGFGFAKTVADNLVLMRHLHEIVALGYPVLLGTSRKSTIGAVLGLPASERIEGTGATVCYGVSQGCKLVRVHDVKEIARMTKMMDAMLGKEVAEIG